MTCVREIMTGFSHTGLDPLEALQAGRIIGAALAVDDIHKSLNVRLGMDKINLM